MISFYNNIFSTKSPMLNTRKQKSKTIKTPMQLEPLCEGEKRSSIERPRNRFRPKAPPDGIPEEQWSGLEDYHLEEEQNGWRNNIFALIMGGIVFRMAFTITGWYRLQTDHYQRTWDTKREFQHIAETKLLWLGIREGTNDLGLQPGLWAGGMMVLAGLIGAAECMMRNRMLPSPILARVFYISAFTTIILTIPVYINNTAAILHRSWVGDSWWGLGELRNRTGYCHMLYYNESTDYRFILPLKYRYCNWIDDIHGLQMLFCLWCTFIAYCQINTVKRQAWGELRINRLMDHCKIWK